VSLADADPYLLEVANRIRALRVLRRLSQDQLARLAPISRVTLGAIERAEHVATLTTYRRIAHGLSIDVGDLVTEREMRWP
jgi:transcriptional regulator with XRE-family HTH domain